jgi:DNA (cytosine-5)-methyltransferase 1
VNELALCAGNGGMSLGLRLAVPEARAVCMVEREGFACADLVRKMQAGRLDQAPIFSDVADFDGRAWRGKVDIVTAGAPCQPFSAAGDQRGVSDERWLWPDIERILGECEPRWVFLENVPGVVQHGLARVLHGLAHLGFDAEWCLFSASSVGAPHIRKRFFLLASPGGRGGSPAVGNPNDTGLQEREGITGDARSECATFERTMWPPGPSSDWSGIPEGLWPAVENANGGRRWEEGDSSEQDERADRPCEESGGQSSSQQLVCGVDHGTPNRVDRLRSLGNGVVPLVVAYAFRTLRARGGW